MRQFGAGKCSNTPASQKVCACDNNNFFRRLKYTDDVTVFPSHADSGYEESKTEINRRNMAMTVEEEGKWISLSTVDAWDVKIKNTSDDSGLNQSRPPHTSYSTHPPTHWPLSLPRSKTGFPISSAAHAHNHLLRLIDKHPATHCPHAPLAQTWWSPPSPTPFISRLQLPWRCVKIVDAWVPSLIAPTLPSNPLLHPWRCTQGM